MFLYQNKDKTDRLREDIKKIKDQIKVLNENLKMYKYYVSMKNGEALSLSETLGATLRFLDINSSNPPSPIHHVIGGENITVHNPQQIGSLDFPI